MIGMNKELIKIQVTVRAPLVDAVQVCSGMGDTFAEAMENLRERIISERTDMDTFLGAISD